MAGICAVALGAANTDQAWVDWLDCLRRNSEDFKPGELSVSSRFRQPRPDPDFELLASGLVFEPLEVRPDPDAPILSYHLGEIDDVCGASERLCRRLADETLKAELAEALQAPGQEKPPPSSPSSPNPDGSRTMTLKEAAKALRISEDTLHRMREKGVIRMFKAGTRWRMLASEVIRVRETPRFSKR